MKYCKDATKLLKKKVMCDTCPIVNNCPRLIMTDAMDDGVEKAIEALLKIKLGGKNAIS